MPTWIPPKYERNTSKNCQPIQSTKIIFPLILVSFGGKGHLRVVSKSPLATQAAMTACCFPSSCTPGRSRNLTKGCRNINPPRNTWYMIQLVDTSVAMLDFRRVLLSLPFRGIRPILLWVVPGHWTLDLLYCQSGMCIWNHPKFQNEKQDSCCMDTLWLQMGLWPKKNHISDTFLCTVYLQDHDVRQDTKKQKRRTL